MTRRQPSPQEMKATCVAAVKIDTASAKTRSGPPIDDTDDLQLPVWTGVIPLVQTAQLPVRAPDDETAAEVPGYMQDWHHFSTINPMRSSVFRNRRLRVQQVKQLHTMGRRLPS